MLSMMTIGHSFNLEGKFSVALVCGLWLREEERELIEISLMVVSSFAAISSLRLTESHASAGMEVQLPLNMLLGAIPRELEREL